MILGAARAIAPTDAAGRYVRALADLRGRKVSGVYGILKRGRWLYIGESHTGRLYDTLTRHFREWKRDPKTDSLGRRRGGTEYNRHIVQVVWIETAPDEAEALQYAAIELHSPADNEQQGRTARADIPAKSAHPTRFVIVADDNRDDPAPF